MDARNIRKIPINSEKTSSDGNRDITYEVNAIRKTPPNICESPTIFLKLTIFLS